MAILSIGFACFDQFFFLNEWPQENTKNFCHDFIESGGGPAANAAWLLGLWGEEVYY
ncbi:kinase, partial [Klebsiella pneumoniae]